MSCDMSVWNMDFPWKFWFRVEKCEFNSIYLITATFSITNPTEYTAHDAVIQTNILFDYFNVVSSTHTVTGHAIELNDISPGTTICSLNLVASNKPGEVRETIILIFSEMTEQITKDISISITGGP